MSIAGVLKVLWDFKVFQMGAGPVALVVVAYIQFFEIEPLKAQVASVKGAVDSVRVGQIEERLDAHYAALCMDNGDSVLLELIRKLEKEYRDITGENYPRKSCDLLLKLK